MKGRTWTAEEKPAIGLAGLNGANPVAEMCREHLPVGRQAAAGCLAAMGTLGIEQVFTSSDTPKGNAETERLRRTIKEELPACCRQALAPGVPYPRRGTGSDPPLDHGGL